MGYIGFRLGLYSEFTKLFGFLGGFFFSFRYYQGLGDFLSRRTGLSIEWAAALSMTLMAVAVYFLLTRLARSMEKLVHVSFEERLNKAGGLIAGVVRAGLLVSFILVVIRQLPSAYLSASIDEYSFSGPTLSKMAPAVYDAVFPTGMRVLTALKSRTS